MRQSIPYLFGVAKPLGALLGAMYVGALSSLYFVQTKKTITEWKKHNDRERRIQQQKFS